MSRVTRLFPDHKSNDPVQFGTFRAIRIKAGNQKKLVTKRKRIKNTKDPESNIPWNKLVAPILISAVLFGMMMNFISAVAFGYGGLFDNGMNFSKIGFLSTVMFLPGSTFLIWLTSKMTDLFQD